MDVFHTKLPTSGAASNNYCFLTAKSYGRNFHTPGPMGIFFRIPFRIPSYGEILWGWKIQVTWGEFRENPSNSGCRHQDICQPIPIFSASQTPLANWGSRSNMKKTYPVGAKEWTIPKQEIREKSTYSSLPENFSIFHGFTTPKIGKPWFFKRTGIFPRPNLWDCRRWFNPDASVQVARKRATFHAGLRIWRRLCWKTSILREGAGSLLTRIFGTF